MYLILESLPVYLSNVICGTASKQTYCIIILTEIDANEIAMVLIRKTINKSACLRFSKNANINRNTDAAKKTAIIVRITDKSVFLGDITKQADKQNEDNIKQQKTKQAGRVSINSLITLPPASIRRFRDGQSPSQNEKLI